MKMFYFIIFLTAGLKPVLTQDLELALCSEGQWRCLDGSCISASGRCNGVVECVDGTDESFPTCRQNLCGDGLFRCTYGGCVNLTAQCDDVTDCVDNSDELLPICRNDVDKNTCTKRLNADSSSTVECINSRSTCDDGEELSPGERCNGVVDCKDGSDEVISTCGDAVCEAPLWTCAYGGCVKEDAECDGTVDCPDGSDETDELCKGISPGVSGTTTVKPICTLPPYPQNGNYIVGGRPDAVPGEAFDVVFLNFTCDAEYGIVGDGTVYCFNGFWSGELPKCVRFCKLPKHPSVEYRCIISNTTTVEGYRICSISEPDGTTVQPVCRRPIYYYSGILFFMHCIDGNWDNIAVCQPECGKITPEGDELIIDGHRSRRGEIPWHVGIYRKGANYKQLCGGSIISTTVVVSAAHCFWSDTQKLLPASSFAVAAGKLFRHWNNTQDDAQKTDVSAIRIPALFQGGSTNYQDDIALVTITTAFEYKVHVRPVCVDFDFDFESRQLQEGNAGTIAGWGLTGENGPRSPVLKVVELPYINIEECIVKAPQLFKEFITSDKICAGYDNGTAVCLGDSGGGLAFPEQDRGSPRYYLRGVASSAPKSESLCNAFSFTTFTQLQRFEHFIKEFL